MFSFALALFVDKDEEKLRKLLIKGLKHDQQWSAAYQDQKETCSLRVMTEQVSAG